MKGSKFYEVKMSAEKPGTLDIYIYSDIEGDSYDWWSGETVKSETSAAAFRDTLNAYQNIVQINVYINSLGGSVMEGIAIYNQLKRHPAQKTAYIDGFACSIASVIPMACDWVVMPANTLMMIHNAWTRALGNAAELRKAADDLDVINGMAVSAYLQKAGDKLDESVLKALLDKETYLTAKQCIEYGLADEYAEKDVDMAEAKKSIERVTDGKLKSFADRIFAAAQTIPPAASKAPEPQTHEPAPDAGQNNAGNFEDKAVAAFSKYLNI